MTTSSEKKPEQETITITTAELQLLNNKLDYLTEQLDQQRQRQQVIDDLIHDFGPISNSMMKLVIDELDEIGNDFELSDVLYLFKRLLRDVRLLTGMLERLEAMVELTDELERISDTAVVNLINILDTLEKRGYFGFARQSAYIMDQIVTEFNEDDVRALGDNIVTILKTVRNMTQPQIMGMANNAFQGLGTPVDDNISTWNLLKELGDPETRKGMARLLHMVKGFAQSDGSSSPQ